MASLGEIPRLQAPGIGKGQTWRLMKTDMLFEEDEKSQDSSIAVSLHCTLITLVIAIILVNNGIENDHVV